MLYNRTPESVIEAPKERIKASKPDPDPGEQIDQRKRRMLRAGIAQQFQYLSFTLDSKAFFPQRAVQNTTSLLLSQFQQKLKNIKPKGFEDPKLAPLLNSEVTPTEMFYRIDKNALVPEVNAQTWNLNVKGLVNKPLTLNYQQIRSMAPVEQFATLECVSNKIGGDLMTAYPRGKAFI